MWVFSYCVDFSEFGIVAGFGLVVSAFGLLVSVESVDSFL